MTVQLGSPYNGETMTVGELIEVLGDYDPDTAVLATWEGVFTGIRKEKIFLGTFDGVRLELIIDVEDYG
jgi:hypothetical protein